MSDEKDIINYPIRMRPPTLERLQNILLVVRWENPGRRKVTMEDTLNRLMDFFEENNPTYQEFLKNEAPIPS